MNNTGNLNYNESTFTPFTGESEVFDKVTGITQDITNLELAEMLTVLFSNKPLIYFSLGELGQEWSTFTFKSMVTAMRDNSIAVIRCIDANSVGKYGELPRSGGVLIAYKYSQSMVGAFFISSVGLFYRQFDITANSQYMGWEMATRSKTNQIPTFSGVFTPAWQGITPAPLKMTYDGWSVCASGNLTLTNSLPVNQSLTLISNLPIPLNPPNTITLRVPYQNEQLSLEINSNGTWALTNTTTTQLGSGYTVPLAIAYNSNGGLLNDIT